MHCTDTILHMRSVFVWTVRSVVYREWSKCCGHSFLMFLHSQPYQCGYSAHDLQWPYAWRQIDAIKWFRRGDIVCDSHIDRCQTHNTWKIIKLVRMKCDPELKGGGPQRYEGNNNTKKNQCMFWLVVQWECHLGLAHSRYSLIRLCVRWCLNKRSIPTKKKMWIDIVSLSLLRPTPSRPIFTEAYFWCER